MQKFLLVILYQFISLFVKFEYKISIDVVNPEYYEQRKCLKLYQFDLWSFLSIRLVQVGHI